MSPRASSGVPRPRKNSEFVIVFGTRQAEKGWSDLRATCRTALADAWDRLTKEPRRVSLDHHPLKGSLAVIVRDGVVHEQWQHELPGGARIWFYVDDERVVLVDVHTHHPNATR